MKVIAQSPGTFLARASNVVSRLTKSAPSTAICEVFERPHERNLQDMAWDSHVVQLGPSSGVTQAILPPVAARSLFSAAGEEHLARRASGEFDPRPGE